jgi:hypothetical protein
MRDRTAVAALLIGLAAAAGGGWFFVATLSTDAVPEADFEVTADAEANELTVEHAGGETITSGSLRILVYEDRPAVPDRTVHGTVWETETGVVQPGDRIELEDRRFEPGQRVVLRWFGESGQAVVRETDFE